MEERKKFQTALVTLSKKGLDTALRLKKGLQHADMYLPENILPDEIDTDAEVSVFRGGIHSITEDIFAYYDGLIYVMPLGIVLRSIAPFIQSKFTDPAVVTVDISGRWAVSTLSGHEGGANKLASDAAALLYSEPVITTSTEAQKNLIVGVGSRRGVSCDDVRMAVEKALSPLGYTIDMLRTVATVDAKSDEAGIVEFCSKYSIQLRVFSRREIASAGISCRESDLVKESIGIGAVAVPCAVMGGTKTELLTDRVVCRGVTAAVAKENFMW